MNSSIREAKVLNQSGFSLLELILVLGLSGVLMGALVAMCGSFLRESSPQAIDYNGNIYEVAPSLRATMSAFDFHQTFLGFLEKSEFCLCFGGTQAEDHQKHRFFPLNSHFNFSKLLTFEPLIQGKFLSTRGLVMSNEADTEGFFEKTATNSDLTCVLLGRDINRSAFVQLRGVHYSLLDEQYNLYWAAIYSMEDGKELLSYRYAVKSAEDTYAHCNALERFFYGEDEETSRESFNVIVFPDPYALANSEESQDILKKSLSRFTYILDVF